MKLRAGLCEESRGRWLIRRRNRERERDRPGQEVEQATDAVNLKEVADVLCNRMDSCVNSM